MKEVDITTIRKVRLCSIVQYLPLEKSQSRIPEMHVTIGNIGNRYSIFFPGKKENKITVQKKTMSPKRRRSCISLGLERK